MPFRKNYFGESIAQPNTTRAELEMILLMAGIIGPNVGNVDLYTKPDEELQFGGTLHIWGSSATEDGDDDINEFAIEFDGFESLDAARTWLNHELGFGPVTICEVS